MSRLEGEMVVSDRQLASAYWQGPDKLARALADVMPAALALRRPD
jgi:hypothetical protein